MGTFKDLQGDPDRVDYGKIAKSLVDQFVRTVTEWGPVPASFHMPRFWGQLRRLPVISFQSHSKISKIRTSDFIFSWLKLQLFGQCECYYTLMCMCWFACIGPGITSESLVLQPRRLTPSVFCEKKILKESSLNLQIDWILEIFINWSIHALNNIYCSHRLFAKFVLPSDHLCPSPRGIRGQVQCTTFAGVRLVWPS